MKISIKTLITGMVVATALHAPFIKAQSCFDMTQLGDFNNIRCIDYNLKNNPDSAAKYGLDAMYGWEGALSAEGHPRQHLITTQGKDDLCPNLNTMFDNSSPSVLLKNDAYLPKDSAKAAAAAFYYTVDPNYPIIQLNYAIVLEKGHPLATKPGCEIYAQPHVRIYMVHNGSFDCLNETYNYNNCKDKEGWTSFTDANSREAIWHDWTTLSIDVSKYAGDKISIVVEAYDCAEANEEGTQITLCTDHETARFYCNLTCAETLQMQQTCTPSQTTLIAPKGFNYKWYATADPGNVLGTSDTLRFKTPFESTNYTCEFISYAGCDAVAHNITIDATRVIGEVKETTLCYDDIADFKWDDGSAFDRNVLTYEFDTITADGCDSIAKQKVVIQDTTHMKAVMDTITESGSYTWRGKTYTEGGTYYDTTRYEITGCDKEYYTLILVAAGIQGEITIAPVCADAEKANVMFTYTESEPKKFNLKFDEKAQKAGFKDTTIAATAGGGMAPFAFAMPKFTEKVNEKSDKMQYVMPDDYTVTISVVDLSNGKKDFTVNFSVLYPSWLIAQRWNDMLLILNSNWNGNHNFSNVQWYMGEDSTEIVGRGEHGSYIYSQDYGNDKLDTNTDYWAALEREDGTIVCTCKMRPTANSIADEPAFKDEPTVSENNDEQEQRVQVAPAVINGTDRVMHIKTDLDGTYTLYSLNGIAIQKGTFATNTDVQIMHVPAGAYIVTFEGNEGTTETKKIIITL